mgnify:CR=1 FL=1
MVAINKTAEIRLNHDCLVPVFKNFPIITPLNVHIKAELHATKKKIEVITIKVS